MSDDCSIYLLGVPTGLATPANWDLRDTIKKRYDKCINLFVSTAYGNNGIVRLKFATPGDARKYVDGDQWTYKYGHCEYTLTCRWRLKDIGVIMIHGVPDLYKFKKKYSIPDRPFAFIDNVGGALKARFCEGSEASFRSLCSKDSIEVDNVPYLVSLALTHIADSPDVSTSTDAGIAATPSVLPAAVESPPGVKPILSRAGSATSISSNVNGVSEIITLKSKLADLQRTISKQASDLEWLQDTNDELVAASAALLAETHSSKGKGELFHQLMETGQKSLLNERLEKDAAAKLLAYMKQRLQAKALLENLAGSLHPTLTSDLQMCVKWILQCCACHGCTAKFNALHETIVCDNQLVETFTVVMLRQTLAEMYDRFSKIAHPSTKQCIDLETFKDPENRFIIRAVGQACGWETRGP